MPLARCLFVITMLLAAASCQKEQASLPRLVSFSDNSNHYSVSYYGSNISEIHVDSGAGAPYTIAVYTYSKNFIRATLHANTGYSRVDYTLKNASLPASIMKYKRVGNVDSLVSSVLFYYRNSSDVLDSVVFDGNTHYNFIPVYADNNITDYFVSTEYGPSILSGSFLYYPIGNVFKSTNPLLWVYNTPVFQFETFMLPRLFSSNTMKKFNGGGFTYDTDAKGNLSMENYGNIYPYKRTYVYK